MELVGYRKKVATPDARSRVVNSNLVELGTLSPLQSSTNLKADSETSDAMLASSVSMPTLFERSCWNRNSDSTLPAYREVARRSLRAKKRNAKSSIIHVDFGGSDPSLRSEETDHTGNRRRLKRAFTDPVRHSDNLDLLSNERNQESAIRKDNETSSNPNLDSKSANKRNTECEPDRTSGAKKELNFQQELYENLSKCLTEALTDGGDLNDSDKSDNDSCIQNGYDEFLGKDMDSCEKVTPSEEDRNDNMNANVEKKGESGTTTNTGSSVNRISVSPQKGPSPSTTPRKSGLTVRDVLRNSDLKIGPAGRTDLLSRQSTDSNSTVNTDSGIDVLSVSGVSVKDELSDPSSPGLKDIKNDIKIICDTVVNSKSLHDRVTVSEFLREEYRKSSAVDIMVQSGKQGNLNKETSVDSEIKPPEVAKTNYRASSESNLLQSTMLEVKKNSDVMVSSASFPELSKLSETVKEPPKLVNKVGHSTVR